MCLPARSAPGEVDITFPTHYAGSQPHRFCDHGDGSLVSKISSLYPCMFVVQNRGVHLQGPLTRFLLRAPGEGEEGSQSFFFLGRALRSTGNASGVPVERKGIFTNEGGLYFYRH